MANLINNMLDLGIALIDLMIWAVGLMAGAKWLTSYAREHHWEDGFWTKLLIRIGIVLIAILIPIGVFNGLLGSLKMPV